MAPIKKRFSQQTFASYSFWPQYVHCPRPHFLQKIDEGGMGVVYMAEQMEPVRRRVAMKVIKAGMDTKQVMARFNQLDIDRRSDIYSLPFGRKLTAPKLLPTFILRFAAARLKVAGDLNFPESTHV